MYEVSCIWNITGTQYMCNKNMVKGNHVNLQGLVSCLRSPTTYRKSNYQGELNKLIVDIPIKSLFSLIQHRNGPLSEANPNFQKSGSQKHFCL